METILSSLETLSSWILWLNYLFKIKDPDATLKKVAESAMREVIGRTPIEAVLTQARTQIETQVMHGTQAILDQYRAGVRISQVQLSGGQIGRAHV